MMENENASPEADHEAMRVLILSRFEDDVLRQREVEVWLDGLVQPGGSVLCDCPELGFCYCDCKACDKCEE